MNYRHTIAYQLLEKVSHLNETDQKLVHKAYGAMKSAYAPYSKFSVGASVLLGNGEVVCGSNQENMAYPSGLCAERVALFYCGANYPDEKIKTLCIVAEGDLLPIDHLLSPCGACRQVMLESENRQEEKYRVILVGQDERVLIFKAASDLLPFAFGNT
jgi:cytidine deaminase